MINERIIFQCEFHIGHDFIDLLINIHVIVAMILAVYTCFNGLDFRIYALIVTKNLC